MVANFFSNSFQSIKHRSKDFTNLTNLRIQQSYFSNHWVFETKTHWKICLALPQLIQFDSFFRCHFQDETCKCRDSYNHGIRIHHVHIFKRYLFYLVILFFFKKCCEIKKNQNIALFHYKWGEFFSSHPESKGYHSHDFFVSTMKSNNQKLDLHGKVCFFWKGNINCKSIETLALFLSMLLISSPLAPCKKSYWVKGRQQDGKFFS